MTAYVLGLILNYMQLKKKQKEEAEQQQ